MTPRYEFFDHTADIGVRVRGPTLSSLVAPAAAGLYAVIGQIVTTGEPSSHALELHDEDPALLLRDYLAALLRLFDTAHQQVDNLVVQDFVPGHLHVGGRARRIDATRSELEREVKAVTYHELAVRPIPGGYEAVFILDI